MRDESPNVLPQTTYAAGKFTPPDGRVLLVIGQDVDSIDAYVSAVHIIPGGIASNTSLTEQRGLAHPSDDGAGVHHLDRLTETYMDSTIILGLSVVDALDAIDTGAADANIDLLLDHLAPYDRPVFLRFGYAFDAPRNPHDPDTFKRAWVRFVEQIRRRNIENVAMVWQSATACEGTYQDLPISAWYPGDEYVDWVGLTYFNQPNECDLAPVDAVVNFAREHGKPAMVAGATPRGCNIAGRTFSPDGRAFEPRTGRQIWAAWFAPFFDYLREHAGTIRAVAYINADWAGQSTWGPPYAPEQGRFYWGDSRVQASPLVLQNWLAEIGKNYWLHGGAELFATLGYPLTS
jgi:hypothetical protein